MCLVTWAFSALTLFVNWPGGEGGGNLPVKNHRPVVFKGISRDLVEQA